MDERDGPLYEQVAASIADSIIAGDLRAGQRAPSQNELAEFHRINPATARKGLSLLADQGILERRRGLGMFVTATASSKVIAARRETFIARYVAPLVKEADCLGITRTQLLAMLDQEANAAAKNK